MAHRRLFLKSLTGLAIGSCLLSCISFADGILAREWTRFWGNTETDVYGFIKASGDGFIYVAGHSPSSLDGQVNAGMSDMMLSKWTANGERIWTRQWGSSSLESCRGMQVDPNGMIYVVGSTLGSYHSQTNNGGWDLALTKWTPEGEIVWTRIWGSSEHDEGLRIALDGTNSIYLAGTTYGEFGDQDNSGNKDIYLSKWTSDGAMEWVRVLGSSELDSPGSIVCDGTHIYVPGHTRGAWEGNVNSGGLDACLTKWTSDGEMEWTFVYGGTSHDYAQGALLDTDGNIYTYGESLSYFAGNTQSGEYDCFVTKWSPDGIRYWNKLWGIPQREVLRAGSLSMSNRIYVAGTTGYPDFALDLVLTELTTSGAILRSTKWGGLKGITSLTWT